MGPFEGTFGRKKHFDIISTTVTAYNKDHRLLRIELLKVATTKHVNSIKAEEKTGLLTDYWAWIR